MPDGPKTAGDSGDVAPGDLLGSYVVERKLGSGGMAEVYFAVHQELSRPAALKVLRSSLATDSVHLQRFMQEARAAAALSHPNIVQVYDVGRVDNLHYIAGEYISGCNLREYLSGEELPAGGDIRTGGIQTGSESVAETIQQTQPHLPAGGTDPGSPANPTVADGSFGSSDDPLLGDRKDKQLGIRETLSIALQVLAALDKSAKAGIVHRDIKPENIMLTPEGEAKVADFGLARVLLGDDPNLTRAGTTLGTPMYMSPEQIQDGEVDIRSDLYSLGVTLFHMLAGQPPFKGDTPLALAMQHVQAEPVQISVLRNDVPPALADVVHRLLAKSPKDRFASPAEVIAALQDRRSSDFGEYWPEQTVPLPGVRQEKQAGLYRETMVLAEKLKANRLRSSRRLRWIATAAVVAGFFALGYWGFSQAPLLANAETVNVTPREQDAQGQYESALLSGTASLSRLEAVVEYHSESEEGQYWVHLARIQIAKLYLDSRSVEKAKRELRKVLSEASDYPELALIANLLSADSGDDRDRDGNLQQAAALFPRVPASLRDTKNFAPWVSQQTFDDWMKRVN